MSKTPTLTPPDLGAPTHDLCLYGTQAIGFTFLVAAIGGGILPTSGPGSYNGEDFDKVDRMPTIEAVVKQALTHVPEHAHVRLFLPNGDFWGSAKRYLMHQLAPQIERIPPHARSGQ